MVFLDVEGPCTLNDNAQESVVASAIACGLGEEIGALCYQRLSVIDDIWGDFHLLPQDPGYSSGHTLKVILPFLRAMGANSQWLYDFARSSLRMVPNIGSVFADLTPRHSVWQISTSYEFYIRAFCDSIDFDFSRVRCTVVEGFDEIPISREETTLLLAFMEEVAQMPVIEYDGETGAIIREHQAYYNRITRFIWKAVYNMPAGEFLRIIHPVGQTQKR